jgi:acetyl-CoA carboxylase/biotin carboxylase 1
MKAKGTIREALEWTNARKYFYWRLRRRLAEEVVAKKLAAADSTLSRDARVAIVQNIVDASESDEAAVAALEKGSTAEVQSKVSEVRKAKVAADVAKLAQTDRAALLEGFKAAFGDSAELQSVSQDDV